MNLISECDIEMLRWIQETRIVYLDNFLFWISYTTTFVSIGVLLLLLYQVFGKKVAPPKKRLYPLLSMWLLSSLISFVLKYAVERARPFVTYPEIAKLSEAGSFSFPSGHTTEAFTIAFGGILLFRDKQLAILIFLWALLVGYSRMSLGVHFPTDVLAGIVVALLVSLAIRHLTKN